jgi:alpha/beta superfamily hydrolase
LEKRVTFPCVHITLEGLLSFSSSSTGVVVCHPHPLYGGEMMNNVVQALVDALSDRGDATLRFNFRGTGRSGGTHGGGTSEVQDVTSAVDYLVEVTGVTRVAVAGYSFGAAVGLRAGMDDPRVSALIGIALPVAMMDGSFLIPCTKPKLLVAGSLDDICPPDALEDLFSRLPDPKLLKIVPGTDHFWFGHEAEAGRAAAAFLTDVWRT